MASATKLTHRGETAVEPFKHSLCKVDKRGGIVLPLALRRAFDIAPNARIKFILQEDGSFLLQKQNSACFFCGSPGPLVKIHGISLCQSCCAQAGGEEN